jgi:hypothetical protein
MSICTPPMSICTPTMSQVKNGVQILCIQNRMYVFHFCIVWEYLYCLALINQELFVLKRFVCSFIRGTVG